MRRHGIQVEVTDHKFFMEKALEEAEKALAQGEFPVGCVMACKNKLLVTSSRTGSTGQRPNELDHAEIAALRNLAKFEEELGKKINRKKIKLFCTLEPCLMCLGAVLLSGVGEIVYAYEDVMGGAALSDLTLFTPLYRNREISIVSNIMRKESLELFRAFFSNPENNYLKGSLLARYTLSQS